jgi:7-cyano-7-deazaguanine synthase
LTVKHSQPRATVLLSGGVDSAACMKFLQLQGFEVHTLFIDYGQRAAVLERAAARALSENHKCPFEIVTVSGNSHFGNGELLGRNAFLIFTALFFLRDIPEVLALGLHSGTHYYDCSEAFLNLANRLVAEHTDGSLTVIAPFLTWQKKDVYKYFRESGLILDETYSCESGEPSGCGNCLSCRDRQGLEC